MSYGLKSKLPEMVESLQVIRKGNKKKAGRDVSLKQYIAKQFKEPCGEALSIAHLFQEMEVDENFTSINDLMETESGRYLAAEILRESVRESMGIAHREQMKELRENAVASMGPIVTEAAGGQRFVSPEVFLDPILRGAVQGSFYQDLIIREIPVAQPQVVMPKIDLSDAALADSSEAATAEEGSITYGSKTATIYKKSRAIKITDEAVLFSPIALLSIYFADFGRLMANTLNGLAVDTIVNGEQTDLSEAATVIGVANTTNGVTWYDIMRAAIRFGLIGQAGTQIIANETASLDFLNLAEVKNRYFGAPLLGTKLRSPLITPDDLYPSTHVGASKVVIQDPSSSIVQLTAQPLIIETDRIVMKQITGTLASIYTGFAKVQRKASVVIDGTILFSGNGFPSYMTPAP